MSRLTWLAPLPWLQGLAARYNVRVTFISGDVHLAAFGCFQSHPKIPNRASDPKFMLQVGESRD